MSRCHAGQRRHATSDADLDDIDNAIAEHQAALADAESAEWFGPTLPLPIEGLDHDFTD